MAASWLSSRLCSAAKCLTRVSGTPDVSATSSAGSSAARSVVRAEAPDGDVDSGGSADEEVTAAAHARTGAGAAAPAKRPRAAGCAVPARACKPTPPLPAVRVPPVGVLPPGRVRRAATPPRGRTGTPDAKPALGDGGTERPTGGRRAEPALVTTGRLASAASCGSGPLGPGLTSGGEEAAGAPRSSDELERTGAPPDGASGAVGGGTPTPVPSTVGTGVDGDTPFPVPLTAGAGRASRRPAGCNGWLPSAASRPGSAGGAGETSGVGETPRVDNGKLTPDDPGGKAGRPSQRPTI